MRDALHCEGAYEETPGVEGLGGIFSGFSEEGVGGGVRGEEEIAFYETALKNVVGIDSQYWKNKILRICIRDDKKDVDYR